MPEICSEGAGGAAGRAGDAEPHGERQVPLVLVIMVTRTIDDLESIFMR